MLTLAEIVPAETARQRPASPAQQPHLQPPPAPPPRTSRRQHDLNHRQQAEHPPLSASASTASASNDPTEKLARALVTYLFGGQAQRPRQQPGLQEPTNADRNAPCIQVLPRRVVGSSVNNEQAPGDQPGGVKASLQRPLA